MIKAIPLIVISVLPFAVFADAVDIYHKDGVTTKIRTDRDGTRVNHVDRNTGKSRGTEAWGKGYSTKEVYETHNSQGSKTREYSPMEERMMNGGAIQK